MDGNFISTSTPTPSNSNADNASPGRNNTNNVNVMHLPRFFIGHPNGIIFRVFKRTRSKSSSSSSMATRKIEIKTDHGEQQKRVQQRDEQQNTSTLSVTMKSSGIVPLISEKIRLPSFISHQNGIVFRAFKRQRSMIEKKKILGPKFICHPNGIVLKVLNQKLRPRKQSTSSSSSSTSSSSMVKMETATETKTKTDQNGAKQRV